MTWARRLEERREQREAEKERNLRALGLGPRSLHRGVYAGTTTGQAVAKECASQHSGYMAAVRNLGYCMNCRCPCRPQFCHKDEGKGGQIKTDCREGWPGCDACHSLFGGHNGGGRMPKEQRRARELEMGRRTRTTILATGQWPKNLPRWDEA